MTCHIRILVSSNFRLAGTANRRPSLCLGGVRNPIDESRETNAGI